MFDQPFDSKLRFRDVRENDIGLHQHKIVPHLWYWDINDLIHGALLDTLLQCIHVLRNTSHGDTKERPNPVSSFAFFGWTLSPVNQASSTSLRPSGMEFLVIQLRDCRAVLRLLASAGFDTRRLYCL